MHYLYATAELKRLEQYMEKMLVVAQSPQGKIRRQIKHSAVTEDNNTTKLVDQL